MLTPLPGTAADNSTRAIESAESSVSVLCHCPPCQPRAQPLLCPVPLSSETSAPYWWGPFLFCRSAESEKAQVRFQGILGTEVEKQGVDNKACWGLWFKPPRRLLCCPFLVPLQCKQCPCPASFPLCPHSEPHDSPPLSLSHCHVHTWAHQGSAIPTSTPGTHCSDAGVSSELRGAFICAPQSLPSSRARKWTHFEAACRSFSLQCGCFAMAYWMLLGQKESRCML